MNLIDSGEGEYIGGKTSSTHIKQMKLIALTIANTVFGALMFTGNSAYARCAEGFVPGGNQCFPEDIKSISFEKMKKYCTNQTNHYGRNALRNGGVSSLMEYYANCMGSSF